MLMRPCLHLDYKSNLVFHNDICTVVALRFTVMVLPARYYCSRWIGRYLVHGWEAWTVGMVLGSRLGSLEGMVLGSRLGSLDGMVLGSRLGSLEGMVLGSRLGSLGGRYGTWFTAGKLGRYGTWFTAGKLGR